MTRGQEDRSPGVVEHETEILPLVQLQVRENLVEEVRSLRFLVNIEKVVGVVQKLNLQRA